jgi:coiled-coil domain-containing protein 12
VVRRRTKSSLESKLSGFSSRLSIEGITCESNCTALNTFSLHHTRGSLSTSIMASTAALSAAAQDRKSRLAQLKSLKRKQADQSEEPTDDDGRPVPKSPRKEATPDDTSRYLSGRNYDAETKGPRLGFENAPDEGQETLEQKAAQLAEETQRRADEDEQADAPLDLFKLQPKKPNWDLKRDLDRKMEVLNVRTDNAIARLVRERIAKQKEAAKARSGGANGPALDAGDNDAAGIEGATLVEATHVREREDEEDLRREREEEAALLDGS